MSTLRSIVVSVLIGAAVAPIAAPAAAQPSLADARAIQSAIIDTLFAGLRGTVRVLVVDSTRTYRSTPFPQVQGVDAQVFNMLATQSRLSLSLRGDAPWPGRVRADIVASDALAEVAADEAPFWATFRARYPGVNALVWFSAIGTNEAGTQAAVIVEHGCGTECGAMDLFVVDRLPAPTGGDRWTVRWMYRIRSP